jgi:hypothetical protein
MSGGPYEVKKTFEVRGIQVVSEVVKDEDSPTYRAFHLKTSCESRRWGTREVGYSITCTKGPNAGDAMDILEMHRFKQAERIVKIEAGEIPESLPTFLNVQIQGPSGTEINVIAQPDLSVSATLLSKELISYLGLQPSARNVFQEQIISPDLFKGVIKYGQLNVETMITPSEHGSPACILGGDFLQKALKGKESLFHELLLPDDRRALANAARCKKTHVLILGKYGAHRPRLKRIRQALSSIGLIGIIVDDYPDIEEQTLPEKVVTYASICRFAIVDDFVPSGHNVELEICSQRGFITSVLRLKGRATTAMQAHLTGKFPFMRAFDYDTDGELEATVLKAAEWADKTVTEWAEQLNRDFSAWRGPNKIM